MFAKGNVLNEARSLSKEGNSFRVCNWEDMESWLDKLQRATLSLMLSLGKSREESVRSLFWMKAGAIMNLINARYGHALLKLSKSQTEKTGKLWFLCTVEKHDWLAMLETPLAFEFYVDKVGWFAEPTATNLQALVDMNSETDYMVAFEFGSDSNQLMWNPVCNPEQVEESLVGPLPWHFTVSISAVPTDALVTFMKWICSVCLKTVAQTKRLKCGACQEQRYCSKVCQRHDWPKHKVHCPLLQQLHKTRPKQE